VGTQGIGWHTCDTPTLTKSTAKSDQQQTDIHVSLLSRENTAAQARSGERAPFGCRTAQLAFCLSAVVPALRRTRHPFAVSGPKAVTED